MEPAYFIENRYSFVVDSLRHVTQPNYEVDSPESSFERSIQRQLAAANRLLMTGKYSAALSEYRHIRGLIAATMRPQLGVVNGIFVDHLKFDLTRFAQPLVALSAEMLTKTPPARSALPDSFRATEIDLPQNIRKQFVTYENAGINVEKSELGALLDRANDHVKNDRFAEAGRLFNQIADQSDDRSLKAAALHDMAVMQERAGHRDKAIQTMTQSAEAFARADDHSNQAVALTALAGIQVRGEDTDSATTTLKRVTALQKDHNLFPIVTGRAWGTETGNPDLPLFAGTPSRHLNPTLLATTTLPLAGRRTRGTLGGATVVEATNLVPSVDELKSQPVNLLAATLFGQGKSAKQMTIVDSSETAHRVRLDANASNDLGDFYATLKETRDVGLLMGYLASPTTTVAYLTHLYSWVLPMAIGDCLAALGTYEEAEKEYLYTLNYPFLNQVVESVNLWLRLAELYLDWGDRLYRQARNDVSEYGKAREQYEKVLRLDNTINGNSPLYRSTAFSAMKSRATQAIQAVFVNGGSSNENPRVQMALWRARHQLFKIDNELNFIGLGVHIPPFSFEYLQNLARYFAQHASQVEQMYIQFKSTAENEELREDQMAQQATLAAASVELEQRGLGEAHEGLDVAQANLNYTDVQLDNATTLRDQFNSVKSELQEISRLQAWAGSASNDEVNLNVTHATYYSADSKPRSHVLFDLANRRAQISNDIESTRLQNEVNSANAYKAVAEQQRQQALARIEVAEQRVAIAQLQQQHAEENLEFLTGREFSSAMWYNLAREARRFVQRYLDMAIEVATMMEKAYEAETGRDLRKIKFEYGLDRLNGLLGADALLLDIDYFSLDHVRTKAKKAQMKQVISMADAYPAAFNRLIESGQTFFETTLDYFDRRYPGFYLQKVKQVELLFVGLNGTEGVHGTLRNIGLSKFRQKSGAIVDQSYPADVMPLTEYNVKQDAIVFQLDSKELRLFENNGIATMWQLDLPLATNSFDLGQILDIQLVLYYDGFFDASLEQQIVAALPNSGSAARALGLRLYAPDELFFLKSQGDGQLEISPSLFPANQVNPRLTRYKLQVVGEAAAVDGLKVRVDFDSLGSSHTFTLDSSGSADDSDFGDPIGESLFETWRFTIDEAENPGTDLTMIEDIALYVEYDFDYRS